MFAAWEYEVIKTASVSLCRSIQIGESITSSAKMAPTTAENESSFAEATNISDSIIDFPNLERKGHCPDNIQHDVNVSSSSVPSS